MGPYRHILIPIDFSEPSKRALERGIELARALDAKLTIAHVLEIPSAAYGGMAFANVDLVTPIQDAARSLLDRTLADVQAKAPGAAAVLRTGVAWQEILAAASEAGADLVVMGTHGRTGISHALIGSVAERVVRHAPIPVLTIPSR